jgi:hypothetical protein
MLGVNPLQHLLAPSGVLTKLSATAQQTITGRELFPGLISGAFHHGLVVVFSVSAALSVIAGVASLMRGGRQTDPARSRQENLSAPCQRRVEARRSKSCPHLIMAPQLTDGCARPRRGCRPGVALGASSTTSSPASTINPQAARSEVSWATPPMSGGPARKPR